MTENPMSDTPLPRPRHGNTTEKSMQANNARWHMSPAERFEAKVEKLVAEAPPLTDDQIRRLRGLFDPAERARAMGAAVALDDMDVSDPEVAHDAADAVLLSFAPPELAEAYRALRRRAQWWAAA